ncbi:hypothetical protein [Salibacterium qingdaonense]|uniref:Uncharacterized protein n=1 Tax=Salibacterium qingdaonense TaxID=266892 RepID=A0A1I4JIC8_9BACI|nr:hypothetical protein [Salibacterium qingdaonense]SFL66320.1 hypothetical protein SAMN04488054_103176 [Salibacterium qingdaonense]
MEALIELIFDNFLILGLIAGGLISLFGRVFSGNEESGEEAGPTQQNQTGQEAQKENQPQSAGRRPTSPVPEAESDPAAAGSPSNPESGYEQQMEELRKKQERARELTSEALRSPGGSSAPEGSGENRGTAAAGIAPITPANAKQGILWAEILGPPVSKRSRQYGTSHRGSRSRMQ